MVGGEVEMESGSRDSRSKNALESKCLRDLIIRPHLGSFQSSPVQIVPVFFPRILLGK
jgi:hypothetical protein